jgi:hypothetical protein
MSTAKIYGKIVEQVFSANVDVTVDTLMCALLDSSYSPNQDVDEFWSEISGAEVTGTGYAAGGVVLAGVAFTYTPSTNTLMIDCDDPEWLAATLAGVRFAVIYRDSGNPASSRLITCVDFLTDQAVTGATLTVAIPVTGFLQATVA